jgi:hypothetical protein
MNVILTIRVPVDTEEAAAMALTLDQLAIYADQRLGKEGRILAKPLRDAALRVRDMIEPGKGKV